MFLYLLFISLNLFLIFYVHNFQRFLLTRPTYFQLVQDHPFDPVIGVVEQTVSRQPVPFRALPELLPPFVSRPLSTESRYTRPEGEEVSREFEDGLLKRLETCSIHILSLQGAKRSTLLIYVISSHLFILYCFSLFIYII